MKWMIGKDNINVLKKKVAVTGFLTVLMLSFLFVIFPVKTYATENGTYSTDRTGTTNPATGISSNLTGSSENRTNVTKPGASDSADDLKKLNIANSVTVTYDNGNGSLNGALRIMITLTLIALAPTLIMMMTSFTRIIIVLHFTRSTIK